MRACGWAHRCTPAACTAALSVKGLIHTCMLHTTVRVWAFPQPRSHHHRWRSGCDEQEQKRRRWVGLHTPALTMHIPNAEPLCKSVPPAFVSYGRALARSHGPRDAYAGFGAGRGRDVRLLAGSGCRRPDDRLSRTLPATVIGRWAVSGCGLEAPIGLRRAAFAFSVLVLSALRGARISWRNMDAERMARASRTLRRREQIANQTAAHNPATTLNRPSRLPQHGEPTRVGAERPSGAHHPQRRERPAPRGLTAGQVRRGVPGAQHVYPGTSQRGCTVGGPEVASVDTCSTRTQLRRGNVADGRKSSSRRASCAPPRNLASTTRRTRRIICRTSRPCASPRRPTRSALHIAGRTLASHHHTLDQSCCAHAAFPSILDSFTLYACTPSSLPLTMTMLIYVHPRRSSPSPRARRARSRRSASRSPPRPCRRRTRQR